MDVLFRKCSRHRLLLGTSVCGVLLCLCLISVLDRWTPRNSVRGKLPQRVSDPAFEQVAVIESRDALAEVPALDDSQLQSEEYARRVQRVRNVCDHDEIAAMRRVWRVATNRRFGKETYCRTKLCPVIVDEKKVLFYCFIPKVASTLVKRFLLNISGIPVNETVLANTTLMHMAANDALRRISPMYYPTTTVNRFYKILFVRHPFDRLVSAFRSKAEPPRSEMPYFYDRYWDKIMKKLRPEGSPLDRITFKEFIWYLTHSVERDYDDHWSPYWSRCDPCLVDYNFIGKLESAKQDFPYAFRQVGIESDPEWWNGSVPTHHSVTLRYFQTVSEDLVRKLYAIYKLDFELFGYSVHEFLPGYNATTS